jgi:hypothetical protein
MQVVFLGKMQVDRALQPQEADYRVPPSQLSQTHTVGLLQQKQQGRAEEVYQNVPAHVR